MQINIDILNEPEEFFYAPNLAQTPPPAMAPDNSLRVKQILLLRLRFSH